MEKRCFVSYVSYVDVTLPLNNFPSIFIDSIAYEINRTYFVCLPTHSSSRAAAARDITVSFYLGRVKENESNHPGKRKNEKKDKPAFPIDSSSQVFWSQVIACVAVAITIRA